MILVIIMMNTLAEKILSLNCPSHLRDRDTGLIKKTLLAHLIAQNSRTCKIVTSPHGQIAVTKAVHYKEQNRI